jgi:enoyl-CoA hydratase
MSEIRVSYAVEGPIATITMDRDAKLNAIDDAMVRALLEALARAEGDPRVRAVVLTGAGRAFSAGFDLSETYPARPGEDAVAAEIDRDFSFIMRFWDAEKPVIAAVHGACLGGAFELMLACDLCVAAENSRLGEPEVTFGSGIVAMLLPWFCGPRRSAELLLRGEQHFDAHRAERWGLVNRVVPGEQLQTAAHELAMDVARNDAHAVRHARRAIKDGYDKAGFREAMAEGVRHCISVEREPSEETTEFHQRLRDDGLAAALAWRDNKVNTTGT